MVVYFCRATASLFSIIAMFGCLSMLLFSVGEVYSTLLIILIVVFTGLALVSTFTLLGVTFSDSSKEAKG
jgi:hypothetical protein